MPNDTKMRADGCRCGAIRFEATLSNGFNTIRRRICFYCWLRGAVFVSAGWVAES